MDGLSRTLMTISCRDCDSIPKHPQAGKIIEVDGEHLQVMHNGIKVVAGGYHGDWMAHVIRSLNGHHEPQEERLFHSVLQACRNKSLIVEVGSFWSYYSIWYLKEIHGSSAICIEPAPLNRSIGERNAALNDVTDRVIFKSAFAGREYTSEITMHVENQLEPVALPVFDMNHIIEIAQDRTVELLHLDVQGAELDFLSSLVHAVGRKRVRFVFVSTHHGSISGSRSTHEDCISKIRELGGNILCEHSVQESFSGDGMIVASFFEQDALLKLPEISLNRSHLSMFPDK